MHGGRVNNSVFATIHTAPIERAVSKKRLKKIGYIFGFLVKKYFRVKQNSRDKTLSLFGS